MKLAPLSRETLISLPTLFTPRIFKLWRCFLLFFAVEVVALEFYNCPRKLHERLRFLTVWGYLMNLAILFVFVDKMGFAHQWVQAVAIFVVAGYLFLAFKFFVFAAPPKAPESPS